MGTHHHHDQKVPRGVLLAAAVLLGISVTLAAQARSARTSDSALASSHEVDASAELRFEDRDDGSVAVLDAKTSEEVAIVPPVEGGFVRGVMRGMFRTRKLESIDPDEHFRLTRYSNGSLVLEDPESGRRVELRSFGPTNYQAFARMLETEPETTP